MSADHQEPRDAEQQRGYLEEHLPYMLKMLRYTYGQILQPQHYLSWNAHFESFAVHARNLVVLLNNSDDHNFKAHDFVKEYRARKGDLQGPMKKLDEQVFHLAKRRPGGTVGKFDTQNAKHVLDWIEENFADFLTKLGPLRPLFNDKKAHSAQDEGFYVTAGPRAPGAPPPAARTAFSIPRQTRTASAAVTVQGSKGPIRP